MTHMGQNDISNYITTADAAKELGISQRHVRRLVTAGLVTGYIVVGKTFLIPRDQLEQIRQRNTKSGPPKREA